MELKGRKVAVLGAGGSGLAAAALALQCGASVQAFDSGDPAKLAGGVESFSRLGVELVCGDDALIPPNKFDVTVISPGIDARWPIAVAFAGVSDELIGEIELAYRFSNGSIIAITGTNGKTTTTALVSEMLKSSGISSIAAGNIGLPFSEVVTSGERYDWIVLELSSFQLETVSQFKPDVAVWMNFAPDHMDRYESVEDYRQAKMRIFENLRSSDTSILKLEDGISVPSAAVTFSAFETGGDFSYSDGYITHEASGRRFNFAECELHGKHNAENVMVALAVADKVGLDWDDARTAITSYKAPAHRCEKIAEVEGVVYINDSKATNLHALESALAGQETPAVLIVGGKDKGLDYSEVAEAVAAGAKYAICIGEIGEEISKAWLHVVDCSVCGDLESAIDAARRIAEPGDSVLFSPGTSSFDMFSSYVERGDAFRKAVLDLSEA